MNRAEEWTPKLQFGQNCKYVMGGTVAQTKIVCDEVCLKLFESILTLTEAKAMALWILNITSDN